MTRDWERLKLRSKNFKKYCDGKESTKQSPTTDERNAWKTGFNMGYDAHKK